MISAPAIVTRTSEGKILARGFTLAQRAGLRRLLDCGAVSEKDCAATADMYVGIIPHGWIEFQRLANGRLLVRFSAEGKRMRNTLEELAA